MSDTHALRRERLGALLAERDVEAALVTRLVNVRYLSGLVSSNAAMLVLPDGAAVLATDGRYELEAADQAPDCDLIVDRKVATALAERAVKDGVRRLAFETHHVTVELYERLDEVAGSAQMVPLGHAVEELRAVKDDAEIEALRAACAISDRAFRNVLPMIRPGVTEREIAHAVEQRFVEYGADGPAFPTIVASGPNGARPHHEPTDRAIGRGDLVTVDFGARYRGYHADMTRTVVVGEPADWQREVYDAVATAQRAGREALRPGADLREVDEAARSVVREAGHADHFPHGLGHGVGLEIHEAPFIAPSATGKLRDGVPVTIEPGVYLPGRGGVRIEDTLVVRAEGPELLTTSTKELLVL